MDVFGSTLEGERNKMISNLGKTNKILNDSIINITMRMNKYDKEIQKFEGLIELNAKNLTITESALERILAQNMESRLGNIEALLPPKFSSIRNVV